MTGDPLIAAPPEPLASCDAAFSCLLHLGGRSGDNEARETNCSNVVNGESLSISRLIELAGDLGIKTEHARLDWQRLQAPGFSYPTLALLKDTNVVVLTGCGRDGGSEVAVWDPCNPYEEILSVPREDFERVWTGHALIITASASHRAAMSPSSDFSWVTSAGIELLGKGQNPKRLGYRREQSNTHSETERGTTRLADRALAPAVHGQLALAHAQVANEQPPRDPVEAARVPTPAFSRGAPERRPSPLVRFCIAAGVIVAAAAGGTLLLTNSATDPVAAAIILAKDVWAVAPNSAKPKDKLMQNATVGSVKIAPRIASAPIPAPPPAAEPNVAAPPPTPTAIPNLAVAPTASSTEPVAPALEPAASGSATASTPSHVEPDAGTSPAAPGSAAPARASTTKRVAEPRSMSGSELPAEEMAALLARGDTLLSVGDAASARLFYERAADAGGGLAAIRLGETYDPLFLDRVHLSGVHADPGSALFWYRRARDLGATDAEVLLKALEPKSR